MGNLFSRYSFNIYETSANESDQSNSSSSSESNIISENQQTPQLSQKVDETNIIQIETSNTPSEVSRLESDAIDMTPQKSVIKNRSKIYAVHVPDSPERYSFNSLNEVMKFVNSPVGKKKGTRFKRCDDENDLDNFFIEQLTVSSCLDESSVSNSSSEPDLPYKDVHPRQLTEFRMAIEKHDHAKFDELLKQNPRFLVNTSNDLPTIVHIGTRYNALHIACRSSNLLAAQKILNIIIDKSWLTDAYATDKCVEERMENFLNAMLNTPDKIENNTPLHYACKFASVELVEMLINFKICNREPINSHDEKPVDLVGLAAKGNKQEIKEAKNRIYCAFRREPTV